jgi:hypothetical protein
MFDRSVDQGVDQDADEAQRQQQRHTLKKKKGGSGDVGRVDPHTRPGERQEQRCYMTCYTIVWYLHIGLVLWVLSGRVDFSSMSLYQEDACTILLRVHPACWTVQHPRIMLCCVLQVLCRC